MECHHDAGAGSEGRRQARVRSAVMYLYTNICLFAGLVMDYSSMVIHKNS